MATPPSPLPSRTCLWLTGLVYYYAVIVSIRAIPPTPDDDATTTTAAAAAATTTAAATAPAGRDQDGHGGRVGQIWNDCGSHGGEILSVDIPHCRDSRPHATCRVSPGQVIIGTIHFRAKRPVSELYCRLQTETSRDAVVEAEKEDDVNSSALGSLTDQGLIRLGGHSDSCSLGRSICDELRPKGCNFESGDRIKYPVRIYIPWRVPRSLRFVDALFEWRSGEKKRQDFACVEIELEIMPRISRGLARLMGLKRLGGRSEGLERLKEESRQSRKRSKSLRGSNLYYQLSGEKLNKSPLPFWQNN